MIRHYFASAFANIARTPVTTAVNVLTLALGLACFLGVYGVSVYWRSGDAHHADAARTFVIETQVTPTAGGPELGGAFGLPNITSSSTLARHLREAVPEIERIARVFKATETSVSTGEAKSSLEAAFADPDFLKIFDLDFVAGDPATALSRSGGLVLTENAAQRLFGARPALGQSILVNNKWTGTVTGVIAPVRQPSFMGETEDAILNFEMLGGWQSNPDGAALDRSDVWARLDAYTFVVLPRTLPIDAFNSRLGDLLARRIPAEDSKHLTITSKAIPMPAMTTLGLDNMMWAQTGVQISAIFVVVLLGGIALGVAVINYANLATAQAIARTKEIGMRRVVGAGRLAVMAQCWAEAVILTVAAFVLSLGVLALAAPVIHSLSSIDVLFFLTRDAYVLMATGAIVLAVAFIAGAYPALVLSGIRPVEALGSDGPRRGPHLLAGVLVAIQFASASFLLILVTVAQLQRTHIEDSVLAPREDPIIVLGDIRQAGINSTTLQTQLSGQPGVKQVSIVDTAPWEDSLTAGRLGRTPEAASKANLTYLKTVGTNYFGAMNMKLVAGRDFQADRDPPPSPPEANAGAAASPRSPAPVVIDELVAQSLGFETPAAAVGQIIHFAVFGPPRPMHVIGVAESDMTRLNGLAGDRAGTIHVYRPEFPRTLTGRPIVRVESGDVAGAVSSINKVWNQLAPNIAPRIQFFDELFAKTYRQQDRTGQIFMALGVTCFAIASTGLIGIAIQAASRRRREIAIRKTLGSSAAGVARLLLTDFSIPVLIGNLLAWPLGYFAAQAYLSAFAYRIELTPAPFLLSMLVTLLIAWAAVIGVVLKIAGVRPAEVLRHA